MAKIETGLDQAYVLEMKDGSTLDVRTSLTDALRWEKAHGGQAFQRDVGLSKIVWVCWCAARRAGLTDIHRADEFAEQVAKLYLVEDDEDGEDGDEDPTSPTA